MFKVESDKPRGLLIIIFSGHVRPEEMENAQGKLKELAAELSPGFRLLTDLSAVDTIDGGCVPYIKANMDLLNERGIAAVIRVIPDPQKDIGLNILSVFHYRRGVKIVTFKTMDEATAALAE